MKKINLLAVLLVFMFSGQDSWAQTDSTKVKQDSLNLISSANDYKKEFVPNYSPLSPSAAALQEYGDYPVNLSTGLPNISIPIYAIKVGQLSLPISLNYHASGHKMEELSSWVGWGWSLSSGSSVSRQVQGIADDTGGNSTTHNYINGSTQNRNFCYSTSDYFYGTQVKNGFGDSQPDIYSFSAGKSQGKFILGQGSQEPMVFPWQALQVNKTLNTQGIISGFDIIDNKGINYEFGTNYIGYQATEKQIVSGYPTSDYTSSWHLTHIQSPNTDDQISLSYQDGGLSFQNNYSWLATIYSNAISSNGHFKNSPTYIEASPENSSTTSSHSHIHKISYPNGEVEFIQSLPSETRNDQTNATYLKQIKVYNYENGVKNLLKTIDFVYSYFKDGANLDGRLKLDALLFKDAAGLEVNRYNFFYHTDTYSWTNSQTFAAKKDFFGYYNGQNNQSLISLSSFNTGSLSNPTVNISNGGANRYTVNTYMKEGVLSAIQVPTVGYTEFDFETNQYKDGSTIRNAGGLRIKSITSFSDSLAYATTKRYTYESADGVGVGQLPTTWEASTASYSQRQKMRHYDDTNNILSTTDRDLIKTQGQKGMSGFEGANVYYTEVKEFFENAGSSTSNGRNEYTFSFVKDDVYEPKNQSPVSPKHWKRGQLLEKRTYDDQNALLANQVNTYQDFNTSSRSAGSYIQHLADYGGLLPANVCPSLMPNSTPGAELIYHGHNYITSNSKRIAALNQTDLVNTSQSFSYDTNLFETLIETNYIHESKQRQKNLVYPTHSSYDADAGALAMRNRNMIAIPLEQVDFESANGYGANTFKVKNDYALFTGNNAQGLTNNLLLAKTEIAENGAVFDKTIIYTQYDSQGKPLEYTLNGRPTALFWGYTNQLLIAIAENSNRANLTAAMATAGVNSTSFSVNNWSGSQISTLNTLQTALPDALARWYAHKPHIGVSQELSSNGLLQHYSYDDYQRLVEIKDHQGDITDLWAYQYADGEPPLVIPSNLQWDTGRNTCSNTDNMNSVFTVYLTGIGSGATVAFSTDGSNWFAANTGLDGYTVSIPYAGGGSQNFWARPSDDPTGGVIFGSLAKCAYTGAPPAAPIISASSGLCSITLTATGCSGTVTWSNSSTGSSISVPTDISTNYTATCSNGNGSSGNSNNLTIPQLPASWTATNISSLTGSCTQESSGTWTLKSDGSLGGASPDSVHYVYKQISGDFTIIVNLSNISSTDGNRAGLLLRNSLDPQSIDFSFFQDGNSYVGMYRREIQGADNIFSGFQQAVNNSTWLKVQRIGSQLYYYYSTNSGNTWLSNFNFQNGGAMPQTISLNTSLYVGLATWGTTNQAVFSNLSISTP